MEAVYDDTSLQQQSENSCYSLAQLRLASRFINDNASAKLLKIALICWIENSLLPQTHEQFRRFEENFRHQFFWKQVEMKDDIYRKASGSI